MIFYPYFRVKILLEYLLLPLPQKSILICTLPFNDVWCIKNRFWWFFQDNATKCLYCNISHYFQIKPPIVLTGQLYNQLAQLENNWSPKATWWREECKLFFIIEKIMISWPVVGQYGDEEVRRHVPGMCRGICMSRLHYINEFTDLIFAHHLIYS